MWWRSFIDGYTFSKLSCLWVWRSCICGARKNRACIWVFCRGNHATSPKMSLIVCKRYNFEVHDLSMRKRKPNEMGMWLPQLTKLKLIKEGILVTSRLVAWGPVNRCKAANPGQALKLPGSTVAPPKK